MNSSSEERWEKLLMALDEKLQLGLLDRLRRVKKYEFSNDLLIISVENQEDFDYLSKEPFAHQLELLVQDATGVNSVKITAIQN